MRLSKILLEAVIKRLQALLASKADDLLLTPEELSEIVEGISDNPNIQQWVLTNITSENAHLGNEIKSALKQFNRVKNRLQVKDLNSYNIESLLDLFRSKDDVLSKFPNAQLRVDPSTLSGVEVFYKSGPLTLYWVEEEEALKLMGEGSSWCTRGSFPNCRAEFYLENHGPQIIATYNNRLIAQISSDLSEIKNLKNNDFSLNGEEEYDEDGELIEDERVNVSDLKLIGIDFNVLVPMILKKIDPEYVGDVLDNVSRKQLVTDSRVNILDHLSPEALEGVDPLSLPQLFIKIEERGIKLPRMPKVEEYILKLASKSFASDAQEAFLSVWILYSKAVGSRIPEFEYAAIRVLDELSASKKDYVDNYMLQIFRYVEAFINKRWPEIEGLLLKANNYITVEYAKKFFGNGWPEAEEGIFMAAVEELDRLKNTGDLWHIHSLMNLFRMMEFTRGAFRSKAEDVIVQFYAIDQRQGIRLLDYVINKRGRTRWPEFEKVLLKWRDKELILKYCLEVVRDRWPEAEPYIMHPLHLWDRYRLAFNIKDEPQKPSQTYVPPNIEKNFPEVARMLRRTSRPSPE